MRDINIGKKLSFIVISLSVLVFAIFYYIGETDHGEESFNLIKEAPSDDAVTLYVYIKPIDSGLSIEARFISEIISFEVDAFPAAQLQEFLDMTCKTSSHKYEDVAPLLGEYGQKLFDPIRTFIQRCSEIEFVLGDDKLIPYPFDLLFFQGKPLFIQKPIAYSFEKVGPGKIDLKEISHALLISDETADPERAVLKVRRYITRNIYKDIAEVKPDDFKTAGPVDLLLISAHGHIFANQDDYMDFGDERLKADDLTGIKPRLVYFDSCFMGASLDFIELFRSSGVTFYVAPWIPNEAGNSSTKTMCLFFESLDLYSCPVYALYLTRKQLYDHFSKEGVDFFVLFRSFPFRVYRFESQSGGGSFGLSSTRLELMAEGSPEVDPLIYFLAAGYDESHHFSVL